ncbi:hypothetical protein Q4555_11615 [Octadecabacter sp. 1_MG-2023]|uniref:hypothetical protein n=1 Tax=unclassified Octadecabacter TaxID=196158 RepID=UPI001C096C4B|nr:MULTISPECIES: hypothetical protein [unclassified Octadecabacter]MBU2993838.1 hypothetical protein [Octadecabacter sp. B2R22]MDO6735316.1 hypothetical protein [Octadecabacter sp. 1_MG-2023]
MFRRKAPAEDSPTQASPLARAGWQPTHKHRKGGLYRLLSYGTFEADMSAVAIYDDAVGTIWVRSKAEFDDGRFTPLNQGNPDN